MTWNARVRQTHRWLSVVFTAAVIVNIIAMEGDEPALWVGLLALIPLIFLLLTGLYLFVLPHAVKLRNARQADTRET